MADKKKLKDIEKVLMKNTDNECPQKDGDNCLVPGVYSDSDPIGGS
jgi:hypothetical protein